MDTILGILLGESYSGIRTLVDLSVCVNLYQQSCVKLQTLINLKFDENASLRFVFDMMCDRCLG